VTINLLKGPLVKLDCVLLVPEIGSNLLSTPALQANRISYICNKHRYKFYHSRGLVARGIHNDCQSFLTWVKDPEALLGASVIIVNIANKSADQTVDIELVH
jgi:hypothetical protein